MTIGDELVGIVDSCENLSQNINKDLMRDICMEECLPCSRVIFLGRCERVQALLTSEDNKNTD